MNKNSDKSKFKHDSANALVEQLLECAMACEKCASACLNEDHVNLMKRCIEFDRDCADACIFTAKLVSRNSDIADVIVAICEKLCRTCAEECRKHDMDHCQQCADVCERCADACREHHLNLQLS